MRLLNCYIENFGKWKEQNFDFSKGWNLFCEENGWGKSTLASFITVMFYGFGGERKQDALQRERARFRPWQGGPYGGRLSFELDGKSYQIYRSFGENQAKDVFELRDLSTHLPCADYSERLGEEIFQIDRESFRRTIFFQQNNYTQIEPTDRIHAKLGDFSDLTGDMAQYDKAMEKLSKKIAELGGRSVNAVLNQRKQKILNLKENLRSRTSVEERLEGLHQEKKRKEKEKEEKEREYRDLQQLREKIAFQSAEAKGMLRGMELTAIEEAEYQRYHSLFGTGIPPKEELEWAKEEANLVHKAREQLQEMSSEEKERLLYLDKFFEQGISPEEEIKEQMEGCRQMETKLREHSESRVMYSQLQLQFEEENRKGKKYRIYRSFAVLCFFACALAFLESIGWGLLLFLGGVVMLAFMYRIKKNSNLNTINQEIADLHKKMAEESKVIAENEQALLSFFVKYQIPRQPNKELDILYQCDAYWKEKKSLEQKLEKLNKQREEIQEMIKGISAFLQEFGYDRKEEQWEEDLAALTVYAALAEKKHKFIELDKKWKEDMQREIRQEITKRHLTEEKNENVEIQSLEELEEKVVELQDEVEKIKKEMLVILPELQQLQEKQEEFFGLEEQLAAEQEFLEEEERKYRLLLQTRGFLEQAKISYSQKYQNPLFLAFEKYYRKVQPVSPEWQGEKVFVLDANLHLTREEYGLPREIAYFSAGNQELISFCMRLAMLEVMYPKQKPFLIIDDSFSNWDEKNLRRGLALLKSLAEEYQILYFTCHESRV
ncbi:MAG: hypothetical protein Q4A29_00140 [Eubacteriales bacterium]|nr:hypothetical protein [Eubacteriales bacterium]